MAQRYEKEFLSLAQQVHKLRDNGLEIGDPGEAEQILQRYGYYRLSGYWFMFRELDDPDHVLLQDTHGKTKRLEKRQSRFRAGTTLEQVCSIYNFDVELRQLILSALEHIEIALRFQVGHTLGRLTAFAHRHPNSLRPDFSGSDTPMPALQYSKWLKSSHAQLTKDMDLEEDRSSETFVDHFKYKYGGPLPVWAATEIMTFGTLTRLYAGLKQRDQNKIAGSLGVLTSAGDGNGSLFNNWLNHLRYVRNVSAHYGRLWNKNMTVQIADSSEVTELAHLGNSDSTTERVYGTLTILAFLLARVDPRNQWRMKLLQFITESVKRLGIETKSMGFPDGWEQQELWQPQYQANHADWGRQQLKLDELDAISPTEAGPWFKPERSSKERLNYLRYLRNNGKLFGVYFNGSYWYPRFQFKPEPEGLYDEVVKKNQDLYASLHETCTPEEIGWHMADYWLTIPEGGGRTNRIGLFKNEIADSSAE